MDMDRSGPAFGPSDRRIRWNIRSVCGKKMSFAEKDVNFAEKCSTDIYNSEFLGFQQREVFKLVRPEPGVRIHDTLTRLEYKEDNDEFLKCKVRLCASGDQQISGVSFQESDLYAPVLKLTEARLLLAIAGANGAKVVKTDTTQAYLYGDMGVDVVYIRPPDWWPELVPEGHVFLLLKSITGLCKRLANGICTSQHGWRGMDIRQRTERRLSS